MSAPVVLFGSMDTKGPEYAYARDLLRARGVPVVLVDIGVLGAPTVPVEVTRQQVAAAAGAELDALAAAADRGGAVTAMSAGAAEIARRRHAAGELSGVLVLGGSNAAVVFAGVAAALPFGVPKVLLSTVASFDTRPYVAGTDATLMYPVVDIAGLNAVSRTVIANAVGAVAGMVTAPPPPPAPARRGAVIALSMFGVTTAGADVARARLTELGHEVLAFHATGVGGESMERLIADGAIDAVLDLTTTELADDLAGGICSAGPDRLRAAAAAGIPQVVSVGALDMVNFGPRATVPPRYADRLLHAHNAAVTLMRTDAAEGAELGRRLATRVGTGRGPVTVYLPHGGISAISRPGGPFHDPGADTALFDGVRDHLPEHVDLIESESDINDADLATAMADRLHTHLATRPTRSSTGS